MSIFNEFPYTNFHEMNLDWILEKIKKLDAKYSSFAIDPKIYNVVSDMITDDEIAENSLVFTGGYYHSNDGGSALYMITSSDEGLAVELDNGLYANPVIDNVYNLKQLGAHADGFTNDYNIIQGLLGKIKNGEVANKPIYAPAGRYVVNDCIVIPSDVWMFGDGETTYFYLNTSTSWSGQVIGICGSNVKLEHVNGGYLGGDNATILFTAQQGFVGVAPASYDAWVNHSTTPLENHSNIYLNDLYTDCQYGIQTESTTLNNTSLITDVTYENIHMPNALVSAVANNNKTIKNLVMRNITASVIRVSGGYEIENLVLDGFKCELLINRCNNSKISNGEIKMMPNSKAYNSNIWASHFDAPFATRTSCTLNNVYIDANGLLPTACAVETTTAYTQPEYPVNLVNVYVTGDTEHPIRGGSYLNAVNCYFDPAHTSIVSHEHGRLVNCVCNIDSIANTNQSYTNELALNTDVVQNYTPGFAPIAVQTGDVVKITAMLTCANGLTGGQTIATLPATIRPSVNRYAFITIFTQTSGIATLNSTEIIMTVTPEGAVTVGALGSSAGDLAAARTIKIDAVIPMF